MKMDISEIGGQVIGPVLFDYVCWMLKEAHSRQIKTIYFLARDGYLPCRIARRIVKAQKLDIHCRYLYCSRAALRLPSYRLIGEEAFDLLLCGGYALSAETILKRIVDDEETCAQIYSELGYDSKDQDKLLSHAEYIEFTSRLRRHTGYRELVREKSKSAYEAALGYLREMGVLQQEHLAIADSGWSGTTQRTLRQLLDSAGFCGRITGFYFGLYSSAKEEKDGEYLAYYFKPQGNTLEKALFNNNIFECFLSAPHGTALTYRIQNNRCRPVLSAAKDQEMAKLVNGQIKGVLDYTEKRLKSFQIGDFSVPRAKKADRLLLLRFIAFPEREITEIYSHFIFTDDIKDTWLRQLAGPAQLEILKSDSLFLRRLLRKLSKRQRTYKAEPLFWPYGTAAYAENRWKAAWYRLNIFAWEWLKFKLKKG